MISVAALLDKNGYTAGMQSLAARQSTTTWGVLLGIALLVSQLVGCGQNATTLSDEQLQVQLEEAERQWKATGAKVTESDAPYITDPKIQAAHKKLKTLQTEHDARAKARR